MSLLCCNKLIRTKGGGVCFERKKREHENTRETFVSKVLPLQMREYKSGRRKKYNVEGMLSKGGIKFIFISASFSRLELDK